MPNWYSVVDVEAQTRVIAAWMDAPTANLETCGYILEMARDQIWAYAPESEDDDGVPVTVLVDDTVPTRLVLAQLNQAVNLWNAGRVNSAGDLGSDGYVFTPRPLDKTIRGMVRPKKGVFSVG
jgi:hypothetical protein